MDSAEGRRMTVEIIFMINHHESMGPGRDREFDPGPVPYFRGDWSWNNFYGHSPPFRWIHNSWRVVVSYKRKYVHDYWLTACSSLPRKKVWLGELTVPQWPQLLTWDVKQQNKTNTHMEGVIDSI